PDRTRRAETRGMIGVAFYLERPPHLVFDEHARAVALQRRRGREVAPAAGNDAGRLLDIRLTVTRRDLGAAGGKAHQRHRSRRQLQEPAAIHGPLRQRREGGKVAACALEKLRRVCQLLDPAPEDRSARPAAALVATLRHLWHTEQSLRVCG